MTILLLVLDEILRGLSEFGFNITDFSRGFRDYPRFS